MLFLMSSKMAWQHRWPEPCANSISTTTCISHSSLAPSSATQAGKQHKLVLSERSEQLWKPCVLDREGTVGDAGGSALCSEQPGLGQLGPNWLLPWEPGPWLLAKAWLEHTLLPLPSAALPTPESRNTSFSFSLLLFPSPHHGTIPRGTCPLGRWASWAEKGDGTNPWVPCCIHLPSATRVPQLVCPAHGGGFCRWAMGSGCAPCGWLAQPQRAGKNNRRGAGGAQPEQYQDFPTMVKDGLTEVEVTLQLFLEVTLWQAYITSVAALAGENKDFLISQVTVR